MRLASLLLLLVACPVAAQISIVAIEGQTVSLPDGSTGTLDGISDPHVSPDGVPGFRIALTNGDRGIWYDDGIVWLNSMAPADTTLTGGEASIGVGANGAFGYSPSINGEDGLWTDNGLLIRETDPAPGGTGFTSFASRPTMAGEVTLYWVGGVTSTVGGSTDYRVFYRSPDRTPGSIEAIYASNELLGGRPVGAIQFTYGTSDGGSQVAFEVLFADTDTEAFVRPDGTVLVEEGGATGDGDAWSSLDLISLDSAGRYVFAGDTDGDGATDEFIAVDHTIAVREGDVVDGVTLGTTVRGAGLNDDGLVVWSWTTDAGTDDEAVFVGLVDELHNSNLIVRTNDLLDVDGDGTNDYVVRDLLSSAFTNAQGAHDVPNGTAVYLPLSVTPVLGGTDVAGIFRFDLAGLIPVADEPTPVAATGLGPIHPNPARQSAALDLHLDAPQAVIVELLDALGRRVALLHQGPLSAGSHRLGIEAGDLAPGAYTVRASGPSFTATRRLVVVR